MIKNIIKWQAISNIIVFTLSLLQVVILSRLLSLSDFGLVAIVMVVINISQVLSDLGMANYLVHKQKISDSLNSTVFWVCTLSGVVLFTLLWSLSPLIASFYGNDEIMYLLPLSAVTFIPISLAAQMQARYTCAFKLNYIAKFDVISKTAGTSIALISAYQGFGASSIIIGGLVASIVKCTLIWVMADKNWWPKWQFSFSDAKNAWNYGVYQIGSQLINQVRANLDSLLLGLYIDKAQLGAYSLAKQLIQKPASFILPIAQKVSLPLLAASQSKINDLKNILRKAHSYVSILLVLPYMLLVFINETIVIIMYGKDNIDVASYIIPLSIFWGARSVGGALVGSLTQGLGKTKIDFYWNFGVLILFSIVCFTLAPYGAYYVSWGLAILQVVLLNFVYFVFYRRIVEFRYIWFVKPILISTFTSFLSSFISVLILSEFIPVESYFLYTLLVSSFSLFLYFMFSCIFQSDIVSVPKRVGMFTIKSKSG